MQAGVPAPEQPAARRILLTVASRDVRVLQKVKVAVAARGWTPGFVATEEVVHGPQACKGRQTDR